MTRDVDERVYRGRRDRYGHHLVNVETPDGSVIGPLEHRPRHSPSGFSWGYGGSGPADLARCLLLNALPDPVCPMCAGTRKVTHDEVDPDRPRAFRPDTDDPDAEGVYFCHICDDGLAAVPYHDFKFQVVAGWAENWRITRTQILEWLARQHEGVSL